MQLQISYAILEHLSAPQSWLLSLQASVLGTTKLILGKARISY